MFKYWIKEHYSDLDPRFLAHFIHFLDFFGMIVWRYKADRTQLLLQPVQKTLCKQLVDVEMVKTTFLNKNFPDSRIPRGYTMDMLNLTAPAESIQHYKLNLLEWDSVEIARQMSLVDFGVFRAIHPKELFGKLKAGETRRSPNVTAISERFNNVSSWVYSTILRTDDINMRAEYIKKFIEIGEKLRELNNFNGLNQIVSGLENNAIFRLKKTWALLSTDGWE
jgi:RasGEF domain